MVLPEEDLVMCRLCLLHESESSPFVEIDNFYIHTLFGIKVSSLYYS